MRDQDPDYADDVVPSAPRDENDDLEREELLSIQRPRLRRRKRGGEGGDREKLKRLVRDIPNFLKLLGRLARDPRVSKVDKGIVLATIGYILMPLDLVPDFLPFLGQVDDIYLLALALDRLLNNAGVDLLLEHWDGEVESLELAISALDKAGSYLPEGVRSLLRQRVR